MPTSTRTPDMTTDTLGIAPSRKRDDPPGGPSCSAPTVSTVTPDVESRDSLDRSDADNAARLVRLHGERLRYVAKWGRYLVFETDGDGGVWVKDDGDVRVRELAKDVGGQLKVRAAREPDRDRARDIFAFAIKSLGAPAIGNMVSLARGMEGVLVDHEDLDRDGWLLNVRNGVIDLRTGALRPAEPEDLMTMQAPVLWAPDATAPRWEEVLKEWFPDDDKRAYVQRLAGSALLGMQRDHIFVVHVGDGRNGKGTFVRALQRVLGPYAVVPHLSLLMQQRHQQHDTVKAVLFRVRLAVASETHRGSKLDEAGVKNLTGGDRISARRMREDSWEFEPTHSLWLQSNYLPEIEGRDQGIWERMRVVRWGTDFSGREDRGLPDALAAEAPGILRWLVEGCLAWQEEGLAEPESVIRDTLAYRKAEDTFGRFCSDVGLGFGPERMIQAQDLQDLLVSWCLEEGIDPPRQSVGDWLREHGVSKRQRRITGPDGRASRPKFWIGVGLGPDGQEG